MIEIYSIHKNILTGHASCAQAALPQILVYLSGKFPDRLWLTGKNIAVTTFGYSTVPSEQPQVVLPFPQTTRAILPYDATHDKWHRVRTIPKPEFPTGK